MLLQWPSETVLGEDLVESWDQAGSNRVLDFHGDPVKAGLIVFSDGNHHMALRDALKAFYGENPAVQDIFMPPRPHIRSFGF